MNILVSVLCGAAWGLLVAWINSRITARSIKTGGSTAPMLANMCRMLLDVAALAAVFLLRGVLPFHFEATIISTAAALSLSTIVFTFMIVKNTDKRQNNEEKSDH